MLLTRHTALVHIIGALIALGYAQNYYFHLRTYLTASLSLDSMTHSSRPPQEQRPRLSAPRQ